MFKGCPHCRKCVSPSMTANFPYIQLYVRVIARIRSSEWHMHIANVIVQYHILCVCVCVCVRVCACVCAHTSDADTTVSAKCLH